jgi:hypothetical protein
VNGRNWDRLVVNGVTASRFRALVARCTEAVMLANGIDVDTMVQIIV